MADTKKPAAKAETKASTKDKSSTDTKTEAKDKSATDAGSGKESSTSDAPKGYSRGENQKVVTDAYRDNWNSIFSKKPRRKSKK